MMVKKHTRTETDKQDTPEQAHWGFDQQVTADDELVERAVRVVPALCAGRGNNQLRLSLYVDHWPPDSPAPDMPLWNLVVVLGDALLIGAVWTYWLRGVRAKLEVLEIRGSPRQPAAEETDASLAGDGEVCGD